MFDHIWVMLNQSMVAKTNEYIFLSTLHTTIWRDLSTKNNNSKTDFISATGIFIVLFGKKEIANCPI